MTADLLRSTASAPVVADDRPRIALIGNPNTGKTTLFNQLCGLRSKTANFPGTTTAIRHGRASLPAIDDRGSLEFLDLPGLYRLRLELPESAVCREVLEGDGPYRRPDLVVLVLDATNLPRNLQLAVEVLRSGPPVVAVLNMVDLAQRRGLTVDTEQLADHLGCPVVPMVARRRIGLELLQTAIRDSLEAPHPPAPSSPPPDPSCQEELTRWSEAVVSASIGGSAAVGSAGDSLTERLDLAFTHPVLGVLVFLAVMGGLFWTLFTFATLPMDLIEAAFEGLGGWLGAVLPEGALSDLLVDGVVGGIAGTVVFLPQICLLFFLISLLEDTGYLARAAFVMDRLLCRFGLPGQAFVPLLSSHACALPGILSTKLIPDRADRLATILVAPFMSCSARLPVYVLLTTLLFADRPFLAGLLFAGCYLLGGAAALGSAFLARRTVLRGGSRPMVLELPSYKAPSLRSALVVAWEQGKAFLHKAGTVIVAICMVMWWLSAYPLSPPPQEATALRQQASTAASAAEAESLIATADRMEARSHQSNSFAGRLGSVAQPLFAPLGYDSQLTVGVLTSFLAREVFVSTMAVLLIGREDADVTEGGVLDRIRRAERADGSPVFTPATAASLLVFFVLAMQCLPTLAVTQKESGSWRWAALQLGYMSGLAYTLAFLTFHGLRLAGLS